MFFVGLLLTVVAVTGFYALITHNQFAALRDGIESAWGHLNGELLKRHTLVGNLLMAARAGQMSANTIDRVAAVHQRAMNATTDSPSVRVAAEDVLTRGVHHLLGHAASYPQLVSQPYFQAMRDDVQRTEQQVAALTAEYNTLVEEYNARLVKMPAKYVASVFGFTAAEPFEAAAPVVPPAG